jgi:hypothetical protein
MASQLTVFMDYPPVQNGFWLRNLGMPPDAAAALQTTLVEIDFLYAPIPLLYQGGIGAAVGQLAQRAPIGDFLAGAGVGAKILRFRPGNPAPARLAAGVGCGKKKGPGCTSRGQ